MQKRCFSAQQIAAMLGASPTLMKQLSDGKRKLTYRHSTLIEKATGLSAARFAMVIVEPNGGELTDIMDSMARSMRLAERSEQRSSRRSAVKA